MTYTDLQEAIRILGLGQHATLREIKTRHRELVKRYHPDVAETNDSEKIRQVNAAYRLLHEFITAYRFSFGEVEFYAQNPEERLRMQFSTDPIWRGR